jgi:hypothetical protein
VSSINLNASPLSLNFNSGTRANESAMSQRVHPSITVKRLSRCSPSSSFLKTPSGVIGEGKRYSPALMSFALPVI